MILEFMFETVNQCNQFYERSLSEGYPDILRDRTVAVARVSDTLLCYYKIRKLGKVCNTIKIVPIVAGEGITGEVFFIKDLEDNDFRDFIAYCIDNDLFYDISAYKGNKIIINIPETGHYQLDILEMLNEKSISTYQIV